MPDDLYEAVQNLALERGQSVASLITNSLRVQLGVPAAAELGSRAHNEQLEKALKRCPAYVAEITRAINSDDFATPYGQPADALKWRTYAPRQAQRNDFKTLFEDAKAHIAAGRTVPWLTRDTK